MHWVRSFFIVSFEFRCDFQTPVDPTLSTSGFSHVLDAIKHGEGRFKGIVSIPNDVSLDDLIKLKNQGIIGAAINPTFEGLAYYRKARVLIEKLAELDMFANIQVQDDDLLMFMPWLEEIPVKILIDHSGRPTPG